MEMVVYGTDAAKEELLATGTAADLRLHFIKNWNDFQHFPQAGVFIDLLFENDPQRIQLLKQTGKLIVINSVAETLLQTDASFVRINAWPGCLQASLIEASSNEQNKKEAETVFKQFNKTAVWLPDEPGFITARVIAMIINEAYFTQAEKISSRQEIDLAMKLGTNYPLGPFEWAQKIGLKNIVHLLQTLSSSDARYAPAPLLQEEAQIS